MKNFKILASSLLASLLLFSCNQDNDDVTPTKSNEQATTNLNNIPNDVATKLSGLGFDLTLVERKELTIANKTMNVWAQDDVYYTDEDLENVDLSLLEDDSEGNEKAFITRARINASRGAINGTRFVSIGFVPGTDFNGNSSIPAGARRALRRAVNTLNNIGSRIYFVISPDGTNNEINFAGTSVNGFPGGSAPGPVNGNFGRSFFSAAAGNERDLGGIMMHEIMHGMGYRHSDFENRQSCRNIGNTDEANVRETQNDNSRVNGTSGNRRNINSVMTACFIGNYNLFQEDINAIRGIYGR